MSPATPASTAFRDARPPTAGIHLDTAACGRASLATVDAVAHHLRHEAELGGYVAQAAAEPVIAAARAGLGALLGFAADDVVFLESASVALTTLLDCWPLPAGTRVGVPANIWGPSLAALADHGLDVVTLPVDATEHLSLQAVSDFVRATPGAVMHLESVGSHRGVVQPVAEVVELAHANGVPVIVDAAQGLGQVDSATDADAVISTSRKWLCGPRGVGVLAVRPWLVEQLVPHAPVMRAEAWPLAGPPLQRFESAEANVAGRVGLGVAVGQLLAAGPETLHEGLRDVGRRTRLAFGEVRGWTVLEDVDEPCAITTLLPDEDVDLAAVRMALLEQGIVTTASLPARAPRQMTRATLRVSPHLDVADDELETAAAALAGIAVVPTR